MIVSTSMTMVLSLRPPHRGKLVFNFFLTVRGGGSLRHAVCDSKPR
jgi:hypothetical protein